MGRKISVEHRGHRLNTEAVNSAGSRCLQDDRLRVSGQCDDKSVGLCRLTFDVRHDEHLRLGEPLLEVVEVDGAVEGDEANLRP